MYCKECGAELPRDARFCNYCGTPTAADELEGGNTSLRPAPVSKRMGPIPPDNFTLTVTYGHESLAPEQKPKTRPGWMTVLLVLLCFVLNVMFELAGYLVGSLLGIDLNTAVTVGAAIGACAGVMLLGGKSLLVPTRVSFLLALKKGWWAILVSGALMAVSLVWSAIDGETIVEPGWAMRGANMAVLCAAIGIYEETMFRGLLLEGLMDIWGGNRRGIVRAAIVSSLLFGFAHIDWIGLSYLDPLSLLQAGLKIVQTGTYGFFLAALVIRAKSCMGAAFLHGFDDLLLMIPSMVLLGGPVDVEYVSTGEDAWALVCVYVVMIVLYIPLVVKGIRMLSQVPAPDRGAFHKS